MIANEPEDFAEAVFQVYTDQTLWRTLADHGYKHAQQHFPPQLVDKQIFNALEILQRYTAGKQLCSIGMIGQKRNTRPVLMMCGSV
ncbi:MAG: hypothetical protein WKF84_15050 [Pyrinomonadaceae bacterium]